MNTKTVIVGCAAALVLTSTSFAQITTVGVLDPNPNGQTIQNSPANMGNANFVTLSTMSSLMTTAFANNTGGVMNFDNINGWPANGAALSYTISYGTSGSQSLIFGRNDGGGGNTMGSTSGSGTTDVSSGQYLAFQSSGSPITLTFSQGLVDWGVTQLNRNSSRDVTLSFTLADSSVINYALQNQDPSGNNTGALNFYGFQTSAANPLMSVTITANGFTRYDDMAFIVAAVPEPGTLSLAIAGGLSLSFMIARRRKV